MYGRRSIKPANISCIEEDEAVAKSVAPDLEQAVNKLVKANVALYEATRVLSEIHPNLIILANKLPIVNGEHPYLQIRKVSHLYDRFRC